MYIRKFENYFDQSGEYKLVTNKEFNNFTSGRKRSPITNVEYSAIDNCGYSIISSKFGGIPNIGRGFGNVHDTKKSRYLVSFGLRKIQSYRTLRSIHEFVIVKYEDEWWGVRVTNNNSISRYICDEFGSVLSLIEYILS